MSTDQPTIAVLSDFLRDVPNGLSNHSTNRSWLAAIAKQLSGKEFAVQEWGYDCTGQQHMEVARYMRSLGIEPGIDGWAQAWDAGHTADFASQLASDLAGVELVLGWGLPNVVVCALESLSIKFIDFEVSPIRFRRDLALDARTNIQSLAQLDVFSAPCNAYSPEVVSLIGWAARQAPNTIPQTAGNVGVIFGQIEIDAALIHQGRLARFDDYADQILEWQDDLDFVLFRPHPYADDHSAFEQLYRIIPTIRPTLMNSYQLLASSRLKKVMALSSGIIEESALFGVQGQRLFEPRRRATNFHYSSDVSLSVLEGGLLKSALAGSPTAEFPRADFALREQFRVNWAFPAEAVASDLYSPPVLLTPEPIAVDQQQDEETVNPTPSKSLYRRIVRETNRIASQVKGVSAFFENTPPKISGLEANAGAESTSTSSKDFSYGSGERQTAQYYYQIRRDHQARYELADKLLPPGIRLLDAFCGNGYGSFLLSRNREVFGIDGSNDAIDVANDRFAINGARFSAKCFPFDDPSQYEAIVSFESIEHIQDGDAFFRFLIDHLKPGGWIFFSTPNEDLLPFDPDIQIHHFRHYSLNETLGFAEDSGLEVHSWYGQEVYVRDGGKTQTLLSPWEMELKQEVAGQFTLVAARKPLLGS